MYDDFTMYWYAYQFTECHLHLFKSEIQMKAKFITENTHSLRQFKSEILTKAGTKWKVLDI